MFQNPTYVTVFEEFSFVRFTSVLWAGWNWDVPVVNFRHFLLRFTSEGSCRFKDEHRPIDQRPTFVCNKCACLVGGETLGSKSPSRVFPVWTRLRSSSRRDVWVVQTVGLIDGVPVWSLCSGQQPRVVSVQSDLGTVVLDLLPALFLLALVLLIPVLPTQVGPSTSPSCSTLL